MGMAYRMQQEPGTRAIVGDQLAYVEAPGRIVPAQVERVTGKRLSLRLTGILMAGVVDRRHGVAYSTLGQVGTWHWWSDAR